ncbi:MAG: hypothetical protein OXL98_10165 [Acidimicrobiaceae bacterium]|nr:hypothetical protein [Acidimicrobiaceae bacterium]
MSTEPRFDTHGGPQAVRLEVAGVSICSYSASTPTEARRRCDPSGDEHPP